MPKLAFSLRFVLLACALVVSPVLSSPAAEPKHTFVPAKRVEDSSAFGQKGSKTCLSWSENNDASLAEFKTPHVVGLYTFGVDKPAGTDAAGYEYWPMLKDGEQATIDEFEKAVTTGFGTLVLGFNEPDVVEEANLDPKTAAALYKAHITPKSAQGYKLASPAVSNGPAGIEWLSEFMTACSGCQVDYLALHWYGTDLTNLTSYLSSAHDQFGLPILLTEYAMKDPSGADTITADEVTNLTKQALQFFDETDYILAACPFGLTPELRGSQDPTSLQESDGMPSLFGLMVINNSY
ncbi:glycosyl hydrolase catalytic core-domain-containing protein [Trametes polyzona]|nr:glycosyl hydrolase catalytic core-domain-containing protein [Trametes polyzona]